MTLLLDGFNHVATLTNDSQRLHEFYREVFGAPVVMDREELPGARISVINLGPAAELNVFQVEGNTEALKQVPMFGRGRIDHLALRAASVDAFVEIRRRLMAYGAADDFVTDFGPVLSVFFRDPDGLECEVCVPNPDHVEGIFNAPGTPATKWMI